LDDEAMAKRPICYGSHGETTDWHLMIYVDVNEVNQRRIKLILSRLDRLTHKNRLTEKRHIEAGAAVWIGAKDVARQAAARPHVKAVVAARWTLVTLNHNR
jgi:hypothetical protein